MVVTVTQENYPGMSIATIDLGLGRAPRNTPYDRIRQMLSAIDGVDSVGGLRAPEGVWGANRQNSNGFSVRQLAALKRVAEQIAARG